jgi:lactase-phlorizin hydrolase
MEPKEDPFLNDTFPAGFQWGAATASYQIEGGWDADGKGENVWDVWCHMGNHVRKNQTGDVACDSYHLYEQDIAMLRNIGVHFYRFSISWSRILPAGKLSGGINEAGVDYYNRLIDGLLAVGIQPMVTLYHWDLPQPLQEDGDGWLNEQIIQHFNDYASVCFQRFGDRVKMWLTFNEPNNVAWFGYGVGTMAPGLRSPDVGTYIVTHNILKAHAVAWHTYDQLYRPTQGGRISITLNSDWKEPLDPNNATDVEAAERAMEFKLGWFANPIYVNGDYPEVMKQKVAEKSLAEGRNQSRLPEFTAEEKAQIVGTHDFFGLNHYTTQLVRERVFGTIWPSWAFDRDVWEMIDPSWSHAGSNWLWVVPWGLRKLLNWINGHYGNPEVYITENGYSDEDEYFGSLEDPTRIKYLQDYINNVLKAVKLDGCNVAGYTVWSLMDNFEWVSGYMETFGLYQVNFTDPARPRTPKASVSYYQQLIIDNGWPPQQ